MQPPRGLALRGALTLLALLGAVVALWPHPVTVPKATPVPIIPPTQLPRVQIVERTPFPLPTSPVITLQAYPGGPYITSTLPPGYPMPATPAPPTSYPGGAATWAAVTQTQRSAEATATAAALATVTPTPTITWTPMPEGKYIDPLGRFELNLPSVGWAYNLPLPEQPAADTVIFSYVHAENIEPGVGPLPDPRIMIGVERLADGQTFFDWLTARMVAEAVAAPEGVLVGLPGPRTVGAYSGWAVAYIAQPGGWLSIYLPVGDHTVARLRLTPLHPQALSEALAVLATLHVNEWPDN